MKKRTPVVILFCLMMLLSACGNANSSQKQPEAKTSAEVTSKENKDVYIIDDLLGKWLCRETRQIITIDPMQAELFSFDNGYTVSSFENKINGDQLETQTFSTYTIQKKETGISMVCNETNKVLKGSEFVKTEELYSEDDLLVNRIDHSSGDKLLVDNKGHIILEYASGGSISTSVKHSLRYAGDQLYIFDIDDFEIKNDNGRLNLVNDKYCFVEEGTDNENQAEKAEANERSNAAASSDSNGSLVVKDAVKTSEDKMTIEELEEKISEQPVRVIEAEVTNGSDDRFESSFDEDMIMPKIINESEQPVKDINIYFMGWDKNNLPVVLKSNLLQYKSGYVSNLILSGVNLPVGETTNPDDADVFQLIPVNETCGIYKAKAIVAVYSTFDGEIWKNPYIQDWIDLYGGTPLE